MIQPTDDRILVKEVVAVDEVKGGIIIPNQSRSDNKHATVVALGTGAVTKKGKAIPFNVKVGNKVLLPKVGFVEVIDGEEKYLSIRESDIIAIVE